MAVSKTSDNKYLAGENRSIAATERKRLFACSVKPNRGMTERASIDDSRLTKDARKLLKTILYQFADEAMPSMSKQERRRGVVELYERGFLEVIYEEDTDRFGVQMCAPDEAIQLNGQPLTT